MTRQNDNYKTEDGKKERKKDLTSEEHHIIREKGTEAPFSGIYNDTKEKGVYRCKACRNTLFSSDAKFDSGSGWPSFYRPTSSNQIELRPDDRHGMKRTEVLCRKCGAHLGHMFDDLSQKNKSDDRRFCINSLSLDLEKDKK